MELDVSIKGLNSALRTFDPKKVTSAARMAVNEAVTAGRTAADREVRKHWNLKTNRTKQQITKGKKASNTTLTSSIVISGRPIDLINFGAKGSRGKAGKRRTGRGGVTVSIHKGKRTTLPHAFITQTGAHTGVFERVRRSRLPIKNLAVITIASMVEQEKVLRPTMNKIRERMNRRFLHHLNRLMK